MAEPRPTAEEAGDPSTSPERLLELAEKHPQLHRLIVLNPSCPEVAREWILATDPWAKQAYEAAAASTAEEPSEPEEPEEPEDDAVASVWGDLGTVTPAAAPPPPAPAQDGSPRVRLSENARVVPLGATPATASSPASAAPAYGTPPAGGTAPTGAVPAAAAAGTPAAEPDDDDRSRRRAWYACGGCLLLALVLLLVTALVGRAWLAGDEEEYQRDSSTTSAEETPSEEPSEEPTDEEEETQDPVSPAPEDAREMSALRSPTGNISCRLEEDTVSCSVLEHDYSGSGVEGCEAGPFSIQVSDSEATRECGSSFLAEDADTLEYDDSATYGEMACTSRFDGMTCWNTLTGKGFMVNRATYETF